jgi:quercetin dioxygenase-like cupin family protein
MKVLVSILLASALLFVVVDKGAIAQDWKKANPKMNMILSDTTLVRAMVVTIQPHEKSDVHSHPAHFFYALTDLKLRVHYTDGKTETYDVKAGEGAFGEPERPHVTENIGSKPGKFLIVELKEHPYAAPK